MKNYDTFIIGELCIDEIVGFDGTSEWSIGGAVVYSSYFALDLMRIPTRFPPASAE